MTCILPQPDRPVVISEDQPDYEWSATHDFVRIMQDRTYWSIPDVPHAVAGQTVKIIVGFSGNEGGDLDTTGVQDGITAYALEFYAGFGAQNTDITAAVLSWGGRDGCSQYPREEVYAWDAARFNAILDNPPEEIPGSDPPIPYGPGLHLVVTSGYHVGLPPGAPHPVAACGTSAGSVNAFVVEIAYLTEGDVVAGETLRAWTEELCPTAIFARTPELDDAGQTTGRWRFITTHPIRANGAEYVGLNVDPCKHHLARRVVGDNGQCWVEYCSTPHGDHDQFKRAHRAGRCIGPVDGAGIEDGQAAWAGTYHAPFWTETIMSSQPQVCDVTV